MLNQRRDESRPMTDLRRRRRDRATATDDAIRGRAYEIYEGRGAEPGHEWDDWFQAERELRREPSRYDNATSEYVLVVYWPDGHSSETQSRIRLNSSASASSLYRSPEAACSPGSREIRQ